MAGLRALGLGSGEGAIGFLALADASSAFAAIQLALAVRQLYFHEPTFAIRLQSSGSKPLSLTYAPQ